MEPFGEDRLLTGGYDCPPVPTCRAPNDCDTNIFGKCQQVAAVGDISLAGTVLLLLVELLLVSALLLRRRRRQRSGTRRGRCSLRPAVSLVCALAVLVSACVSLEPSFALARGVDVEEHALLGGVSKAVGIIVAGAIVSAPLTATLTHATPLLTRAVLELGCGFAPLSIVARKNLRPSRLRQLAFRITEGQVASVTCVYVVAHTLQMLWSILSAAISFQRAHCHYPGTLQRALICVGTVRVVQLLLNFVGCWQLSRKRSNQVVTKSLLMANIPCVFVLLLCLWPMFEEIAIDVPDTGAAASTQVVQPVVHFQQCSTRTICLANIASIAAPFYVAIVVFMRVVVSIAWDACRGVRGNDGGRGGLPSLRLAHQESSEDVLTLLEMWSALSDQQQHEEGEEGEEEDAEVPDGNHSWECPICLEEDGGKLVQRLPCGHRFHFACIERSFLLRDAKCPLCRRDVALALLEELDGTLSPSPRQDDSDGGGNVATGSISVEMV